MAIIDSNGTVINGVLLTDRVGTPSVPTAGDHLLFSGSGGIYSINSSGSVVGPIGSTVVNDYICIQDQKSNNTGGGSFTSGGWRTRDLNTEVSDSGNHASVAANQITLDSGTYICKIIAPAYAVRLHKARLFDTTSNTTIYIGQNSAADDPANTFSVSIIAGKFTIAVQSVLEVQHYCSLSYGGGFGVACNFGVIEVYTIAEFWKVG